MKLSDILQEKTPTRKTRIRNGEVQRRKKTCQPGYKLKDGRCVKQDASEKNRRRKGARKANKKSNTQRKRSKKRSDRLRKRRNL